MKKDKRTKDERIEAEFPERDLSNLRIATQKFLTLLYAEYLRSVEQPNRKDNMQ
jgi:hypothetical protein